MAQFYAGCYPTVACPFLSSKLGGQCRDISVSALKGLYVCVCACARARACVCVCVCVSVIIAQFYPGRHPAVALPFPTNTSGCFFARIGSTGRQKGSRDVGRGGEGEKEGASELFAFRFVNKPRQMLPLAVYSGARFY